MGKIRRGIRTGRLAMALKISMPGLETGRRSYFLNGRPLMSPIQTCFSFSSDDRDDDVHEDSSTFAERRVQSNSDASRANSANMADALMADAGSDR